MVECGRRRTFGPDEDVAAGVAAEDVAVVGEGQTGDVLGLVARLEEAELARHRALLQRPEANVRLAARDEPVALHRVELDADHQVAGTLGLGDLEALVAALPVPQRQIVVGRVVHHHQQVAAVLCPPIVPFITCDRDIFFQVSLHFIVY